MTRYEEIAQILRERVAHGVYRVGDRLPSIRGLCQEFNVSVSTAQAAYGRLEDEAVIEARPKSGYYLLPRNKPTSAATSPRPEQRPLDVSQWDQVFELIGKPRVPGVVPLGRGIPDLKAASLRPLTRQFGGSHRIQAGIRELDYDELSGDARLRRQVVRLAAHSGCLLHPDQILITAGCQEALSIAVRVLTNPGDVVAVDSPSFYGTMQILRARGLKALEIPTDPETGMSLEALELALDQWPIRVIQVTPTCNNPIGYTMPEKRKQQLIRLAQRFDVAIIEDDVYGDLAYDLPRPRTVKSFDDEGRVLLCSSVSKTLAPGMRVGWIAPGRYQDQATHMKYVTGGTTAMLPQRVVADFLSKGHYESHLRSMNRQYRLNRDTMQEWVLNNFPEGTRVNNPGGGFVLWVTLPEEVDCVCLNKQLSNVQIAPGSLFSATGKFRNCMRLSYAARPTAAIASAVRSVGQAAVAMMDDD